MQLSSSPLVVTSEEKDLFSSVIDFIDDTPAPQTKCYRGAKYSLLGLSALVSGTLYIEGSIKYCQHDLPLNNLVLQLIGNIVSAVVVNYNLSHVYIEYNEKIKEILDKLGIFIDPARIAKAKNEKYYVYLGSFSSAVPLGIPAYTLSTDLPEWLRILKALGVTGAYTLGHAFAIYLLLHNLLTRTVMSAPFLPFIYFYNTIQSCLMTEDERYYRALTAQTLHDQNILKEAIINNFRLAITSILHSSTKSQSKTLTYLIDFTNSAAVQDHLRNKRLNLNGYLALLTSAEHTMTIPNSRCETGLRRAAWLVGATTMTLGVGGYIAGSYNSLDDWTSKVLAGILTSMPTLITSVITIYFGGNRLQTANKEIPLAIKLYPKTAATLIVLSAFVSVFCAGTGAVLAVENLPAGLFRDMIVGFSLVGIPLFGFASMLDWICARTISWAEKSKLPDHAMAVRLLRQLERLTLSMSWIDGTKLETTLQDKYTKAQREKISGLKEEKIQQLLKHEENLHEALLANQELGWFSRDRNLPRKPRILSPYARSDQTEEKQPVKYYCCP